MAMHTPSAWTFWVSVALVLLAVISWFIEIRYISDYALWVAVIGYLVLVVGCRVKTKSVDANATRPLPDDQPRRVPQPLPHIALDMRQQRLPHARVIGVEPFEFIVRQKSRLDQTRVDRYQRDRLETEHLALRAFDGALFDDDEVFDADAIVAGFVIAGLVGEDHARLERSRADFGDPLRAFMHGEIGADAMARAVIEIEARVPQRLARKRSSCAPDVPLGKTARLIAILPLSTRVKRSRISAVGRPTASVRVISVVPSSYWPPLSIRKMPLPILRFDEVVTR